MQGNIFHYASQKCKPVTRAVLALELYAMSLGVDFAIAASSKFNIITKKLGYPNLPVVICTDSLSLYECMVKLGTTKEKRLMIDIMAIRESYERRELSEIRWISGSTNPADSMTKVGSNSSLQGLISTNTLSVMVEGWVERPLEG